MPATASTFDTVGRSPRIPEIVELNIGHFLVGEAIFVGLEPADPPHARADGRGARRHEPDAEAAS